MISFRDLSEHEKREVLILRCGWRMRVEKDREKRAIHWKRLKKLVEGRNAGVQTKVRVC